MKLKRALDDEADLAMNADNQLVLTEKQDDYMTR